MHLLGKCKWNFLQMDSYISEKKHEFFLFLSPLLFSGVKAGIRKTRNSIEGQSCRHDLANHVSWEHGAAREEHIVCSASRMLLRIIFPGEGAQSEKPARGAAWLRSACITKKNDSLPAWALLFFLSAWMIGQCPAASLAMFSPGKTARRSWSKWRQFVRCRPPPDWWRRACRWCPGEVARPVWLLRLFCEMHRWRVWVRSSQWHPQSNKLLKNNQTPLGKFANGLLIFSCLVYSQISYFLI